MDMDRFYVENSLSRHLKSPLLTRDPRVGDGPLIQRQQSRQHSTSTVIFGPRSGGGYNWCQLKLTPMAGDGEGVRQGFRNDEAHRVQPLIQNGYTPERPESIGCPWTHGFMHPFPHSFFLHRWRRRTNEHAVEARRAGTLPIAG